MFGGSTGCVHLGQAIQKSVSQTAWLTSSGLLQFVTPPSVTVGDLSSLKSIHWIECPSPLVEAEIDSVG